MADTKSLYQEVILDHNRKPRNYGELAQASHKAEGHNPLCGDRLRLDITLDGDRCDQKFLTDLEGQQLHGCERRGVLRQIDRHRSGFAHADGLGHLAGQEAVAHEDIEQRGSATHLEDGLLLAAADLDLRAGDEALLDEGLERGDRRIDAGLR